MKIITYQHQVWLRDHTNPPLFREWEQKQPFHVCHQPVIKKILVSYNQLKTVSLERLNMEWKITCKNHPTHLLNG